MRTKLNAAKVYSAAFIAGFLVTGAAATADLSVGMAAPIGLLICSVFAAPAISTMANRGEA